jgi:putative toxin-antitoxin system antitoxin component (TIGR02293 family)
MPKNDINEGAYAGTWRAPRQEQGSGRFSFEGSIGVEAAGADDLIDQVKAGLAIDAFTRLQAALGVTASELATVIGLPSRTLARRKKQGRLSPEESEHLVRIARLYEMAVDVMGHAEEARRWMKTARPALGNRTPLERADTELGAREVEDLLGRIAYGVFY